MNKLSKIFLIIIIVLVIALTGVTISYFKVRKAAQENLNNYLDALKQITELKGEMDSDT